MHYGKTAFGSGKVTMETTDAYYKDLIGKTYSLDDNNLWKGFMIVVYAMVIYNPGHNIMGTFEFSCF